MSWYHSHCIYSQRIFTITPDIINFKTFKNSEPDIVLLTTCTCRQTDRFLHTSLPLQTLSQGVYKSNKSVITLKQPYLRIDLTL